MFKNSYLRFLLLSSTCIDDNMADPLKSLPKSQLNAVKVIVKKIEWLLKDEIASALRAVSPVTETTLDKVAEHVQSSKEDNCKFEYLPLRFVFGLDKSLQLFLNDLGNARVEGYLLRKEGKYYYLTSEEKGSTSSYGKSSKTTVSLSSVEFSMSSKSSSRSDDSDDKGTGKSPKLNQRKTVSIVGVESDITPQDTMSAKINAKGKDTDDETFVHVAVEADTSSRGDNKEERSESEKEVEDILSQKEASDVKKGASSAEKSSSDDDRDAVFECVTDGSDAEIMTEKRDEREIASMSETIRSSMRGRRSVSVPPKQEDLLVVRRRFSDPLLHRNYQLDQENAKGDSDESDTPNLPTIKRKERPECIHLETKEIDPDFWLFARLQDNGVMVFFHTRYVTFTFYWFDILLFLLLHFELLEICLLIWKFIIAGQFENMG